MNREDKETYYYNNQESKFNYNHSFQKIHKTELEDLVEQGVFEKSREVTEHVALHPIWLSNPVEGIQEKFDSSLGTWRPRWVTSGNL